MISGMLQTYFWLRITKVTFVIYMYYHNIFINVFYFLTITLSTFKGNVSLDRKGEGRLKRAVLFWDPKTTK